MTTRREAREHALALCYEMDVRDRGAAELLADLPAPPAPYTEAVVRGVSEHHDELDRAISEVSEHWALERMTTVDRALLRIGAYELMHRPDVPVAAVISEAVELAKRYSTEESGRFVNGILSALAARLRPAGEGREGFGDTAGGARA